ncbi:MAG: helix-turn-helix domain-containing protein [Opitutaceae bacterium]|nr:helix-turn-helix domain-containing protein [Opitutaceae bacterium]
MKRTADKPTFATLPNTYTELTRLQMPRPIHDDVGYKNTVEMIDALAGHALNRDQSDYLAILSDQVEAYEKATLPPDEGGGGLDTLKYLMEEHGLTGEDLAGILGVDRSLAYRILRAERNLTPAHMKTLARHFGLSPASFL